VQLNRAAAGQSSIRSRPPNPFWISLQHLSPSPPLILTQLTAEVWRFASSLLPPPFFLPPPPFDFLPPGRFDAESCMFNPRVGAGVLESLPHVPLEIHPEIYAQSHRQASFQFWLHGTDSGTATAEHLHLALTPRLAVFPRKHEGARENPAAGATPATAIARMKFRTLMFLPQRDGESMKSTLCARSRMRPQSQGETLSSGERRPCPH